MPRSDNPSLPRRRRLPPGLRLDEWLAALRRGKRPGCNPDSGGVPVEPNRPNTLSGGAAAPLEFDD